MSARRRSETAAGSGAMPQAGRAESSKRPDEPPTPRRLPKASDYLAEVIRTRILAHGLQPGDVLPSEGELMEEQGLSRATVREGLRLVEAEGLITVKRGPRGGVFVRYPDLGHFSHSLALILALSDAPLHDLFEFRSLLEPAAAALAAERATSEQRDELVAHTRADSERPAGERVALHIQVADATNNALIRLILNAIHELVRTHSARERLSEADLRETSLVHERIAAAVAAGDAENAERAMRRHLERYRDRMAEEGRLEEPIVPRSRWEADDGIG